MFVLHNFVDAKRLLSLNAAYKGDRTAEGVAYTHCHLHLIDPEGAAELVARVRTVVDNHYPLLPTLDTDYVAYTVMGAGARHTLHADAVRDADGTPNHTPNRVATALLYLTNDGVDHSGGVLHLPGMGLRLSPRAGMLVGMLTDWDHRHEVSQVDVGERHAVAFWFREAIG